MKSPEYVRDVTAIWRRLLDERRGATAEELRKLAEIFSRGGFTDAYFCGMKPDGNNSAMLGVRSTDDKAVSVPSPPSTPSHAPHPLPSPLSSQPASR